MATAAIELYGKITNLYFSSPKFTTGRIEVSGHMKPLRFKISGLVTSGRMVTLLGNWATDPKWGRQFAATDVLYKMPIDPAGVEKWLRNNAVGIGVVKAARLVEAFGESFIRMLRDDPQQVAIEGNLPIECVTRLLTQWESDASHNAAVSQLLAWGFTQAQAELCVASRGVQIVEDVRDDPYCLIGSVDGFGWDGVDKIGLEMGITGNDPRRRAGAVVSVVRDQYSNGSTAIKYDTAWAGVGNRLNTTEISLQEIHEAIGMAITAGKLVHITLDGQSTDVFDGSEWFAMRPTYAAERYCWDRFKTSRDPNPATVGNSHDLEIGEMADEEFEAYVAENYGTVHYRGQDRSLDAGQVNAVITAARNRFTIVTGGAGTGKTLVSAAIYEYFNDRNIPVYVCAPTGKAAKRISEVLGVQATTIHRLLEWKDAKFQRNAGNPFRCCAIICDEFSMADTLLLSSLLEACSESVCLVGVGDPNQLPPVGAGYPLRDIIAHALVPVAALTGCHRQAGVLKENCSAILDGRVAPWVKESPPPWVVSSQAVKPEEVDRILTDLYSKHLPAWGYDPIADAQVMTAQHDGPYGTKRLNLVLQKLHQETIGNADVPPIGDDDHKQKPIFYVGDKVIQTSNNYTLNVFNGDVGVIESLSPFVVRYEFGTVKYPGKTPGEISLGYVLSVHKMQGSENPCAIVICSASHRFMLNRNWLYTAVTRAQKTAIILGDPVGINVAAGKEQIDTRSTVLRVLAGMETAPLAIRRDLHDADRTCPV